MMVHHHHALVQWLHRDHLGLVRNSRSQGGSAMASDMIHESSSSGEIGSDVWARRVERVLTRAVTEERIVGAVMLVARDGDIVYRRAVGQADREAARPMKEDTIFRIASLTKPIVSIAALSLFAQGALALDEPVTRWLPQFRPALADGTVPPITVRHLLTHTSGLGYGFFDDEAAAYDAAGVSSALDQPGLSFEENVRRLATVPLLSTPGTAFRYSLSTDLLGGIVAQAAGSSLPEVVARLITRPLGMAETSFEIPEAARLAVPYGDGQPRPIRMTDGHLVQFPGGRVRFAPSRARNPDSYPSGGGGMLGTADDYMRFLEAVRVSDPRLLDGTTFEAMKRDQIGDFARPTVIPGDGWGFGFGLAVLASKERAASPMSVGSYRWEGAYGHSFWVDPVERISALVMTNTALEGMFGKLPSEIQRAVYQR
jgi:CubicO group peptidase (beta-lactamase class C family)